MALAGCRGRMERCQRGRAGVKPPARVGRACGTWRGADGRLGSRVGGLSMGHGHMPSSRFCEPVRFPRCCPGCTRARAALMPAAFGAIWGWPVLCGCCGLLWISAPGRLCRAIAPPARAGCRLLSASPGPFVAAPEWASGQAPSLSMLARRERLPYERRIP